MMKKIMDEFENELSTTTDNKVLLFLKEQSKTLCIGEIYKKGDISVFVTSKKLKDKFQKTNSWGISALIADWFYAEDVVKIVCDNGTNYWIKIKNIRKHGVYEKFKGYEPQLFVSLKEFVTTNKGEE